MVDEQKQFNDDASNFKNELKELCHKYQIDLVANAMIQNGLIVAGVRLIRMEKKDESIQTDNDVTDIVIE